MTEYEILKAKCLALTGTFETSMTAPTCFGVTAGNFDKQGMSFGVLQWNLGSNTLQPILKNLITRVPTKVKAVFGDGYQVLSDMLSMTKTKQIAWATGITNDKNAHSLLEPWKTRFLNLGLLQECQDEQVKSANDYFNQALRYFRKYGFYSERAFAMLFDIAVQCWSISDTADKAIMATPFSFSETLDGSALEVKKMQTVATIKANEVDPQWQAVVKDRKLAIANGTGTVYGSLKIDCTDYGIRLIPATVS